MPNLIKFKRGAQSSIPTLADGEAGWTTDSLRMYIGQGTTNRLVGEADFLKLSGGSLTSFLTLHADPTSALHAASKQYVDNLLAGIKAKSSVKAASTGNLTLSGTQTVDGVVLSAGDRCLAKNQSTTAQNGMYVVAAGAWARTTDADSWNALVSMFTWVEQGTANGDSGWLCTVDAGGTLGSTAVTYVQFSGAGQITAGAGLTKTGNTIDVIGTANRITANTDSIDIASTYVGQTSITTLGTVATGTWSATAIAADKGGTGQTAYTIGDLLYASTSSVLSKLADVATGSALISGGVGVAPSYGKIGLTTHISGTLGPANGGTGVANNAASTIAVSGNYGLTLTLSGTTGLTLPTSGTLATTAQLHTQNTDTGTTAGVFQLASGASGARLKEMGGWFALRNSGDTGYVPLECDSVIVQSIQLANATRSKNAIIQYLGVTDNKVFSLPEQGGTTQTLLTDASTVDGGTW
ncbi:MAG TPA: hypothetical protein VLL97_09425 [Acidobacteriota bacterium]|nr:hypothetical protein [Acidobacteriota bacterium]